MLTSRKKAADVVSRIDRVRCEQFSQPIVCKKKGKHRQHTKPPLLAGSLVLGAAAYMGSSLDDLSRGLILVLLEVLHEQGTQLLDLALEVGGAVPALGRVEKLVGNVGAGLGNRQVEGLVGLVLNVCELAGVNGIKDGASVLERAALA